MCEIKTLFPINMSKIVRLMLIGRPPPLYHSLVFNVCHSHQKLGTRTGK